jgi:Flp pilus assembly pilin Flp
MKQKASFGRLLRRIHNNEQGALSIETILILGAIAIPILIFILKFGWPKIKDYFNSGMNDLESQRSGVMNNN